MVLSEHSAPALLQSLAGGKSLDFFISGWKSTRLAHCAVGSKLGIRNNSALGPSSEKLLGNWPGLHLSGGASLVTFCAEPWLEALRGPWLVALPAQGEEAALWDSSAISSHHLCPSSCGQFRCNCTAWWYLLVFSHSVGRDLPLEYLTHLWNIF